MPDLIQSTLETYQVGSCLEALIEGILMAPLDPRCTQVGFNLFSAQVWGSLIVNGAACGKFYLTMFAPPQESDAKGNIDSLHYNTNIYK